MRTQSLAGIADIDAELSYSTLPNELKLLFLEATLKQAKSLNELIHSLFTLSLVNKFHSELLIDAKETIFSLIKEMYEENPASIQNYLNKLIKSNALFDQASSETKRIIALLALACAYALENTLTDESPFQALLLHSSAKLFSYLLLYLNDIPINAEGQTPLHMLCCYERKDTIQKITFLFNKFNERLLNCEDANGKTALALAWEHNNTPVIDKLMRLGVDASAYYPQLNNPRFTATHQSLAIAIINACSKADLATLVVTEDLQPFLDNKKANVVLLSKLTLFRDNLNNRFTDNPLTAEKINVVNNLIKDVSENNTNDIKTLIHDWVQKPTENPLAVLARSRLSLQSPRITDKFLSIFSHKQTDSIRFFMQITQDKAFILNELSYGSGGQ